MDPIIGEVRSFGFSYVPEGWVQCNGQKLLIQQYAALYSIIGIAYGGDAKTYFNVPNLLGMAVLGYGTNPTGSTYDMGDTGGENTITLLQSQMPFHTHTLSGATAAAPVNTLENSPQPAHSYISNPFAKANPTATSGVSGRGYAPGTPAANTTLNPLTVSIVGSQQEHTNMMPYVTTNYCIAFDGIYLPRP